MHPITAMINAAAAANVEQYARKRKDAPGQRDLFSGEERASKKTQGKLRWITLKGEDGSGGAHVQINGDGDIVKGPAALAEKGIKNLNDFGKGDEKKPKKKSKPKDRDAESIEKMAPGAKRRQERENKQRDEWHEKNDSSKWDAHQPEWTEHEGTPALQVPGSQFVAVAANGRKDSKNYVVFDTSADDPDEEYAFLKKNEVHSWLAQRSKNAADDREKQTPAERAASPENRKALESFYDDGVGASAIRDVEEGRGQTIDTTDPDWEKNRQQRIAERKAKQEAKKSDGGELNLADLREGHRVLWSPPYDDDMGHGAPPAGTVLTLTNKTVDDMGEVWDAEDDDGKSYEWLEPQSFKAAPKTEAATDSDEREPWQDMSDAADALFEPDTNPQQVEMVGEPADDEPSLADLQAERKKISDRHIWDNAMSTGSTRPAPPDTSELDKKISKAEEREGKKLWQRPRDAVKRVTGMPEAKHRKLVEDALKRGKDVPAEVLADYPDLQAGSDEAAGETKEQHRDRLIGELAEKRARTGKKTVEQHEADIRDAIDSGVSTFGTQADAKWERANGGEAEPETESPKRPTISESDVDYKRAAAAYAGISMVPDERAKQEQQQYKQFMDSVWDDVSKMAKSPEQQMVLDSEFSRFQEGYLKKLNAHLDAKSRTLSPMVTGPSNFPTRRNQKRFDTERRRLDELLDYSKKAQAAMRRNIRNAMTSEQLAEESHNEIHGQIERMIGTMKAFEAGEMRGSDPALFKQNFVGRFSTAVRDASPEVVQNALDTLDKLQTEHLKKPVFTKRHKIWKFAEHARNRVEAQKNAPTGTETVHEVAGHSVERDHDDDRVRIFFDGKPDADVRRSLKSSGWRWSPRNSAWQRKNTANSVASAKSILAKHYGEAKSETESYSQRITAAINARFGDVEKYGQGSFNWDESAHPRASDGRFGNKAGDHGGGTATATKPKKPGVQGMQMGLFDEEPSGQKTLFNVSKPSGKKKPAKPAAPLSLLEQITEGINKRAREMGPSLEGQQTLFGNADDPVQLSASEDYQQNGTKAAAFKNWFGDWESEGHPSSRVIDDDTGQPAKTAASQVTTDSGEPRIVFHGTGAGEFESFNNPYGGWNMFSESRKYSEYFASGGGRMEELYLNIRKPFDLSELSPVRGDARANLLETLMVAGIDTSELEQTLPYERDLYAIINGQGRLNEQGEQSREVLKRALADAGYDGIKMPDHRVDFSSGQKEDVFATTWIAFEPTQIKSVDNSGEFSTSDERMKYAREHYDMPGQRDLMTGQERRSSKTQGQFRWVTIGGHADGDKQHAGGNAVLIDGEGNIVGGNVPKHWQGQHVGDTHKLDGKPTSETDKPDPQPEGVPLNVKQMGNGRWYAMADLPDGNKVTRSHPDREAAVQAATNDIQRKGHQVREQTPQERAGASWSDPPIETSPGLNEEDARIERETQERARREYPKLRDAYAKLMGTFDNDGNLKSIQFNTDEWRGLFPEYQGTNAHAVHEAASYLNKRFLAEALETMKGVGNNSVLLLAGGGGSGKGSATKEHLDQSEYPIVIDQVSDKLSKSSKAIDQAKANGYSAEVAFVDRHPEDAWRGGVVPRAVNARKKGGLARTVPLDVALQANINARMAALDLLKSDPDAKVSVINNNVGPGLAYIIKDRDEAIQFLESQNHDFGTLREKLANETRELHERGVIPDDIAAGLLPGGAAAHGRDEPGRAEGGDSGGPAAQPAATGGTAGTADEGATHRPTVGGGGSPNEGVAVPGEFGFATVGELKRDPSRFQYKMNTNKAGVTDQFKDINYNPMFGGVLHVWKDPETGESFVVNGHHRHELAERSGHQGQMPVFQLDTDSAEEARAYGALVNIAGGNGTAIDAAKFMRDAKMNLEQLQDMGVSISQGVAKDAGTLSKLSPRLFERVATGLMKQGRAIAIAQHVDDHDSQERIAKQIDAREEKGGREISNTIVGEIARQTGLASKRTETQGGLFGNEEVQRDLDVERADLVTAVRRQITNKLNKFKAVSNDKAAETLEGHNRIDAAANRAESKRLAGRLDDFNRESSYRGTVSDIINRHAEALADEPRRRNDIISELAAELESHFTAVPDNPREAAGAQSAQPQTLGSGDGPGEDQERHQPLPGQRAFFSRRMSENSRVVMAEAIRTQINAAFAQNQV